MAQYARNEHNDLRVLQIYEDKKTFRGESRDGKCVMDNQKVEEYYFYEFC